MQDAGRAKCSYAVALNLVQNDFKFAVGSRSRADVMNGKAFPVTVDVSDAAEISGPFKGTEQILGTSLM